MNNTGNAQAEDIIYMAALDERLQKNPFDADALIRKGFLFTCPYHRESDEIIATFDIILKNDPSNVDAYFWLAECLHSHTCAYEEIEKALYSALALDPNRADCHLILALTLESYHNDIPKTEFHYRKAVELEPTWPGPLQNFTNYLLKLNKLEDALEILTLAIPLLHENIDCTDDMLIEHYESLVTYRSEEHIKKHLSFRRKKIAYMINLRKKLAENPDDLTSLFEMALLSAALFRNHKEARRILSIVIEHDPENILALIWLGNFYCEHPCDYAKAEELARKVLALAPRRADGHILLAKALNRINEKNPETEFHYRKAIELEPCWAIPHYELGYILLKLKHHEEAKKELLLTLALINEAVPNYTNDNPIPEYYASIFINSSSSSDKNRILSLIKDLDAKIADKNKPT